jgi:hypothetical protein
VQLGHVGNKPSISVTLQQLTFERLLGTANNSGGGIPDLPGIGPQIGLGWPADEAGSAPQMTVQSFVKRSIIAAFQKTVLRGRQQTYGIDENVGYPREGLRK